MYLSHNSLSLHSFITFSFRNILCWKLEISDVHTFSKSWAILVKHRKLLIVALIAAITTIIASEFSNVYEQVFPVKFVQFLNLNIFMNFHFWKFRSEINFSEFSYTSLSKWKFWFGLHSFSVLFRTNEGSLVSPKNLWWLHENILKRMFLLILSLCKPSEHEI